MKNVSTDSASAAELETPHSMDEAMGTGFLPDDEHYRLTGEFKPEKKDDSASPKKDNSSATTDASAAATKTNENESENDDASAASSRKAAASETAQAQKEEGRQNAGKENRWQKRERELKELREKVARLESKPQTGESRSEPQQTSQAAAAETKAAPKPKIDDLDEKTGKPKYKNFSEYEDAKDTWLRQEAIREFQAESAKSAQVRERTEAERKRAESFNKKFEAQRAKYQDFDQVALNPDLPIPAGSVTDLFLDDSEHAGEVLYHLGQHPDILGEFHPARSQDEIKAGKYSNTISPQRQFRKLLEIEALVSASSPGETHSAESSSDKTSSAKPVTQASRPPHQVSTKGTVAKDAVEQALDDGDFEIYQRIQNAKELARLKRK